MDAKQIFKDAFDVAFLRFEVMRKIAHDGKTFKPALLMLGLAAFLRAFGYAFFPPHFGPELLYRLRFFEAFLQAFVIFILSIGGLYFIGYLAKQFFHSKLNLDSYFRVMAYAHVVVFLGLIPVLGFFSLFWLMAISWAVLRHLAKLGELEAAFLVIVQFFILGAFSSPYLQFAF